MYQHGEQVETDPELAAFWFLEAASRNHPTAQYEIGICYAFGDGVQENAYEALFWLSLANAYGDPDAAQARELLVSEFTTQDLENNYARVSQWLAEHPQ